MKKSDQPVPLLQRAIFSKPKAQLLKILHQSAYRTKKPLAIFTPNPEQLVLAQKSRQFAKLLARADYLIPDGIGLVWASRLLSLIGRGQWIAERISGIDLTIDLLEWAAKEEWPVLLLGGKDYNQAENRLIHLTANGNSAEKLQLVWLKGYENISHSTKAEEARVVTAIQKLRPQLVFVAFGAPWQEQWVVDHSDLLRKSDTKIVMVVGGTFDILFGRLRRAPLWMRSLGLEWFYRLVQEPQRARRQLALIHFMGLVLLETLRGKRSKVN
jgi:N-acetylglucosaminyldiphosphoundecaprenol N-acetyl-beta-D-mannosaminyltransferase